MVSTISRRSASISADRSFHTMGELGSKKVLWKVIVDVVHTFAHSTCLASKPQMIAVCFGS